MSTQKIAQIHAGSGSEQLGQREPSALDVVFVHGLGGERYSTWTNSKDELWPAWLAADFPNCRIFTAGYESGAFGNLKKGAGATIQDLAGSLADELASMTPPSDRLLLISHSLGGLVAKQMLRRCKDSANGAFVQVGRATSGLIFLGTPHAGAQLSNALDCIIKNCKSSQTQQLSYGESALIDLNEFFRNHVASAGIKVGVYYETQKTWGVMVVDRVTSNPNVLGAEPIAVEADHIGICKPEGRDSKLYASICRMVRELIEERSGGHGGGGTEESEDSRSRHSDTLSEYGYFTAVADDDRRSLEQKLKDAGRSYQVRQAERAKERFAMALQRNIAQPSAVARYTRLMSDVESRYSRHVARVIAEGGSTEEIDSAIQSAVVDPCAQAHSAADHQMPATMVDGALYYLAGNCHLAFDDE